MSEDKDALDFDLEDGNPDGLESMTAEQIAEESHSYGEVTAEDLGSDELIDDGADPAFWVPEDADTPVDVALRPHEARNDTGEGETIDEYDLLGLPSSLVRRIAAWQHDFDETENPPATGDDAWWERHEQ